MTRITVLGGTGYAGSHLAAEAARRGHEVLAVARKAPAEPLEMVNYLEADVLEPTLMAKLVAESEVVVDALSPRGALEGRTLEVDQRLANAALAAGVRIGVIGGAGSLLLTPDGPMLAETPDFPDEIKPEATERAAALELLRASDEALDWFFVSPAASFGAWAPGEHTGVFRVGGDVLLATEQGRSEISGADLAQAIVDEIEIPTHRRARFTVAY